MLRADEKVQSVVPMIPHDVLKTYGIEAARAVLLREFDAVISFNGTDVDPRHLKLLADG